jgi:pimeloyl-ACP methyl ester carboxylesterase
MVAVHTEPAGFAASPPLARGDFEAEAPLIAELLGDGAHLVGHSYGAVIALLAAQSAQQRCAP